MDADAIFTDEKVPPQHYFIVKRQFAWASRVGQMQPRQSGSPGKINVQLHAGETEVLQIEQMITQ